MYNAVAENVLGTLGTVFWCIQLVPQIIRNYKVKNCEGLPPSMMFLWAASGVPFSIYFFGTDGSIPLRIQPQLFTFFCMVSWAQTLYYPPYQISRRRLCIFLGTFIAVTIGLEIGFILWLRPLYREGKHWPMLIMGIIASVLLAVGLIPPYFELAKRQGRVVGINFVFLFMDSTGALLSMLSVLVGTMDIMSMVLYAIVLAMEIGIAASHIIWYFRMGRQIIKEEKEEARRLKEEGSSDTIDEESSETIQGNEHNEKCSSSFAPLNVAEDPTVSKKDLEEEHTRELQVEQAFKIFQDALAFQKKRLFLEAYRLYEDLFKLDVISNHYNEEEDLIRGIQNGGANTVLDELAFLSPNVKSLRYLIFRNRGFLYFNILQQGGDLVRSLIKSEDRKVSEVDKSHEKDRFKQIFYTLLDDMCISLIYQEGDEKLLETLFEIFIYIDANKLARFTLEYSLSGKEESDDLLGVLPISDSIERKYRALKSKLYDVESLAQPPKKNAHMFNKIHERLSFLEPIRVDYHNQVASARKLRRVELGISAKESSLSWLSIIEAINGELKSVQDESKMEEITRTKLKLVEPYLLTENSLERLKFALPNSYIQGSDENESEVFEDAFDTVTDLNEAGIEIEKENDTEKDKEAETETENKEKNSSPSSTEKTKSEEANDANTKEISRNTLIQRSSKRLAKVESSADIPDIVVERVHFDETKRFFETINSYFQLLGRGKKKIRLSDIVKNYVPGDGDKEKTPLYVKDFISVISDWNSSVYTKALFSNDDVMGQSSSSEDEKVKLLEVLNDFGKKSKFKVLADSSLPKLEDLETREKIKDTLIHLNETNNHYEDVKLFILRRLLGIVQDAHKEKFYCLIIGSLWSSKLFSRVKEWVLQFESMILSSLLHSDADEASKDNLSLAVSIHEILVDVLISTRNQICDNLSNVTKKSTSKFNKAGINNMSVELVKLNDKITRWSAYIQDMFYHAGDKTLDDQIYFNMSCRFKWSQIQKDKSQSSALAETTYIMESLESLIDYIEASQFPLSVEYPNHENLIQLSVDSIRAQLTTTSVISIFSRILYSDSDNNASDAIELLHSILIDGYEIKNDQKADGSTTFEQTLIPIKEFLNTSPIDMKLSLWSILSSYYTVNGTIENFQYGFEKNLEFLESYLTSEEYSQLEDNQRMATFVRVIGFYGEKLNLYIETLAKASWNLPIKNGKQAEEAFARMIRFLELLYLYSIHEEACVISSLKVSVRTRSATSYQRLKDILVATITAILIYYKTFYLAQGKKSNSAVSDLLSIVHEQLGARNLCDSSEGQFLKFAQETLVEFGDVSERDLSQLISCRYHYNISVSNFTPKDHGTSNKDELDLDTTHELARFVLPLCFKKNPIVNIPKHDTKVLIDEFYAVIGDPNLESNETLSRNDASFDYFLETTRITPRLIRDAFHGLLKTDFDELATDTRIIKDGLYYLEGLLIFSSYKVRKKNMQSRAVELENVIMLLKNDLIYCTDRTESWYLLGQAFGFLVEDDLIWTSDKLTVADRKVGTANLQRKSLLCYLMAINGTSHTRSEEERQLIRPIIEGLMSSFAKELYSACMEPMSMHAFKVQGNPRFIRKASGASFVNVAQKSPVSLKLCLKVMQQCFHIAVKSLPTDWTNFYYLSKVQRKLKKDPELVLDTLSIACKIASEQSTSQEHIIEPHYMLSSLVYKYVKFDKLEIRKGLQYFVEDPVISLTESINDVKTKEQFYKLVVAALKKVDSYDKKNWQHKPRYRLATILFDEFDDVSEALEEMSSFVSLKATSKTLVSIWKPEQERPGKHFYYTFQYSRFYITLLTHKLDLIGLISMLPKLRRSNSTMVQLYTTWEILCSSICKIMRSSIDIDNSFTFTENFLSALSYSAFMLNARSILDLIQNLGIPKELEIHFCYLHAINDMKKFNNGFGPTSLIDDTIVGIFIRIYLHFNLALEPQPAPTNSSESPGGKTKKLAKRDIFPFTTDILKNFRREVEAILKEKPDIYNDYVRESVKKQKEAAAPTVTATTDESRKANSTNEVETIAEDNESQIDSGVKTPERDVNRVDESHKQNGDTTGDIPEIVEVEDLDETPRKRHKPDLGSSSIYAILDESDNEEPNKENEQEDVIIANDD
ncbi:uncharacterized protein RJT20DRAFT_5335 [Scheffersomyces xylosifermentans]|uniref:uncharacterized protein n=1 Tax=Scheffersomyces xylosifermentans TaxID=1304137 RepID=UPI00315D1EAC